MQVVRYWIKTVKNIVRRNKRRTLQPLLLSSIGMYHIIELWCIPRIKQTVKNLNQHRLLMVKYLLIYRLTMC